MDVLFIVIVWCHTCLPVLYKLISTSNLLHVLFFISTQESRFFFFTDIKKRSSFIARQKHCTCIVPRFIRKFLVILSGRCKKYFCMILYVSSIPPVPDGIFLPDKEPCFSATRNEVDAKDPSARSKSQ